MKAFIDNALINRLTSETDKQQSSLISACLHAEILKGQQLQIVFGWPSLLEYLDMGYLLVDFPIFDQQNELFTFILSILPLPSQKDLLIRLYDQVFVECLTQVKALPHINPTYLLSQIQRKRQASLSTRELFAHSLEHYENLLTEQPANAMHQLILYLAWDRVCVNLAIIFEHISPNIDIRENLDILKECLVESFQHITAHGKTTPGFFRLIEALYAYQMREENIPLHTDAEWALLSQSAIALKPRAFLHDVWYIDAAVIEDQAIQAIDQTKEILKVMTLDSADKVKASLSLVHYMIEKLKQGTSEWRYSLYPLEIICLKEKGGDLIVDTLIQG